MAAVQPGRYVYHGAPADLGGGRLVPLFDLARIDPAAFEAAMAKYEGRESAPYAVIPGLGVRFNDTVHCAPIHPWYIRSARAAEGLTPDGSGRRFYRIPVEAITVNPVVWYSGRTVWINGAPGESVPLEPAASDFEPFDADRYSELTAIPDAYPRRLREALATGDSAHVRHDSPRPRRWADRRVRRRSRRSCRSARLGGQSMTSVHAVHAP